MKTIGIFPFGQPVREVVQTDRSPMRVFVLGVYASAVHARWIGIDGKDEVKALAVTSEPKIFWRGEGVDSVIEKIFIPPQLGRLVSADKQFNGPSGKALDALILKPLGLLRENAWLCDLVPHSCANPSQIKAVETAYLPKVDEYSMPKYSVPHLPNALTDEKRREEILDEIAESKANTIILLGDQPIKWFLAFF